MDNYELAEEYEQEVNKLAALNDLIKNQQKLQAASDVADVDDDFDTFLAKLNARRQA